MRLRDLRDERDESAMATGASEDELPLDRLSAFTSAVERGTRSPTHLGSRHISIGKLRGRAL
jgi:hypothetical protein